MLKCQRNQISLLLILVSQHYSIKDKFIYEISKRTFENFGAVGWIVEVLAELLTPILAYKFVYIYVIFYHHYMTYLTFLSYITYDK